MGPVPCRRFLPIHFAYPRTQRGRMSLRGQPSIFGLSATLVATEELCGRRRLVVLAIAAR